MLQRVGLDDRGRTAAVGGIAAELTRCWFDLLHELLRGVGTIGLNSSVPSGEGTARSSGSATPMNVPWRRISGTFTAHSVTSRSRVVGCRPSAGQVAPVGRGEVTRAGRSGLTWWRLGRTGQLSVRPDVPELKFFDRRPAMDCNQAQEGSPVTEVPFANGSLQHLREMRQP